MPIARSSLVGATSGVVLLAGALGLGVGLPKLTDEQYGASDDVPTLPDRIGGRFLAASELTPEDVKADNDADVDYIKKLAASTTVGDASGNDALADVYGDAATRTYVDVEAFAALKTTGVAPAVMTVSVVEGSAGLVMFGGPIPTDQNGSHYELKTIDGYPCAVAWNEPVDQTTGQPTGEKATAANYQVECRGERNGLAYDVLANGVKPDEVATYLTDVMEKTKS